MGVPNAANCQLDRVATLSDVPASIRDTKIAVNELNTTRIRLATVQMNRQFNKTFLRPI